MGSEDKSTHQGNGKKPRVLILSSNASINQSLESRFELQNYDTTFVDSAAKLAEPNAADHDIFIVCAGNESYGPVMSEELINLNKLLLSKNQRDQPYLAVLPKMQKDGTYWFTNYTSESNKEQKFDEPMRIVRNAFADLNEGGTGALDELLENIKGKFAAPRAEAERPSLEMLASMIGEKGGTAELYLAIGRAYEQRSELLRAIDSYQKAFALAPHDDSALQALGSILLNDPNARQLPAEKLTELLAAFGQAPKESAEIDQYKNAVCLALGDEESLRQVIQTSKKYEDTATFVTMFPMMIDAYSTLAFISQQPEDSEQLYESIEKFVRGMSKVEYPVGEQATVGMRLVKKHTGRHTVFDIVPSTRAGLVGRHVFVKAITPKQRRSAQIEFENISALGRRHRGVIKTHYAELSIPQYAVIAQKPNDLQSTCYVVTPLLPGERSDRFLEKENEQTRRAYLKPIMATGIALQTALQKADRVIEPEEDFYSKRFEDKILARAADLGIVRMAKSQQDDAARFFKEYVNDPLENVPKKLHLPYTGSHTLKNILIDEHPVRSLDTAIRQSASARKQQGDASKYGVIGRCDIEDASNRFFVCDHVLSIEDSAIGIPDTELREFYDRLLLMKLTSRKPKYQIEQMYDFDSLSNAARVKAITRLLREQKINMTRDEYHERVTSASLERHLTFAFDRIKEMAVAKARLKEMEAENRKLKSYGVLLHKEIDRQANFSYQPLFDQMMEVRGTPQQEDRWNEMFLYISTHQDSELFMRSKNYHLDKVRLRVDQLGAKAKKAEGYQAFDKLIEAAAAYK